MNKIRYRSVHADRPQTGFSLVELMVALAISMFLVIGIIQLFVGSKQTYRFYDALSRLQENGRFALNLMAQDIRMAGYYGCASAAVNITNTLNTPTAYFWNFTQPIQGFESTAANTWTPTLDASIVSPSNQGNADVITVRGVDSPGMAVLLHGGGVNDPRVVSGFASCDIAAISTCQAVSIFQVTGTAAAAAITGSAGPPVVAAVPAGITLAHTATTPTCTNSAPGNASNNLGPVNYAGGEIAPVSTKSYYLRTGSSGQLALWRRMGALPSQEIVEGVERMQIVYGVDTAPTGVPPRPTVANSYVTANAVTNWNNVVSVRIDLLLASLEDNLVTSPQSIVFPAATGATVTVNDRRVRQAFSTTVAIRNRLP